MLQRATVQELVHCFDSLQARPHYTSELWTLALCTMGFYFLASTLERLRACCSVVQRKTTHRANDCIDRVSTNGSKIVAREGKCHCAGRLRHSCGSGHSGNGLDTTNQFGGLTGC